MIASTAVRPPPPGIRIARRDDAVELAIARPGRVRRALVVALASGVSFVVAALATALDARVPKEVAFVVATIVLAFFGGSMRAAILGRRPLRVVADADHLAATNARPWSMQNVVLARAAIAQIEAMPNGVAARLVDGRLVPIATELDSDEVAFVEAALHSAAASAASSSSASSATAREAERSFASST